MQEPSQPVCPSGRNQNRCFDWFLLALFTGHVCYIYPKHSMYGIYQHLVNLYGTWR